MCLFFEADLGGVAQEQFGGFKPEAHRYAERQRVFLEQHARGVHHTLLPCMSVVHHSACSTAPPATGVYSTVCRGSMMRKTRRHSAA
jgi:hypothetical protein